MQEKNKTFAEKLKIFEKTGISSIDIDVITCVKSSLSEEVTDEEFNDLCSFTKCIWNEVEKGYTQLIADIVVDLYQDCGYDYRDEDGYVDVEGKEIPKILTIEQITEQDEDVKQMVKGIFYEEYYKM